MGKRAAPITEYGMYTICDETQEGGRLVGYMHDAARPFVVLHRYHRGYKGGMSTTVIGRYTTRKAATAAISRHSAY